MQIILGDEPEPYRGLTEAQPLGALQIGHPSRVRFAELPFLDQNRADIALRTDNVGGGVQRQDVFLKVHRRHFSSRRGQRPPTIPRPAEESLSGLPRIELCEERNFRARKVVE
ncbi:hypothetical protein D3C83_20290 [compost metagenome]